VQGERTRASERERQINAKSKRLISSHGVKEKKLQLERCSRVAAVMVRRCKTGFRCVFISLFSAAAALLSNYCVLAIFTTQNCAKLVKVKSSLVVAHNKQLNCSSYSIIGSRIKYCHAVAHNSCTSRLSRRVSHENLYRSFTLPLSRERSATI
jgi:hypothetical protein